MNNNNNNNNNNEMRVQKRNGLLEEISFDKILVRIKKLGLEANIHINYSSQNLPISVNILLAALL